jgi:hypothetical protein
MDANSAFGISLPDILAKTLEPSERGDHNIGRVRDAAHITGARESGSFENTATACARLLKIQVF